MTDAIRILGTAEAVVCRPWLRHVLTPPAWSALAQAAAAESWIPLAQWADTVQVHALLLDPNARAIIPISTAIEAGRYPALSPHFPGAALYERMIHDLWGHAADGAPDLAPWLDHGMWPQPRPMAAARAQPPASAEPPPPPQDDDPDRTLLPLGPIWGQIDEPAGLRLTLLGSTIQRADSRLGFAHKGILSLMRGKPARAAARFAARLSADATVAHATAFAQATEAACDTPAPPRAQALRIVMLEIERIANHLDNLAETGRLADALALHARCGALREILLRATQVAFGHRLMMDCVVPGGIALDMADGAPQTILRALGDIASALPAIRTLQTAAPMASRLTGIGRISGTLAASLAVGGIVGRASGHAFDARALFMPEYRPYTPRLAIRTQGDAAARQHVRLEEIQESLRLISTVLHTLPSGDLTVALPQASGEGIGCAESVRGDVWHWLRLDHGQIAAVFPRDPGWALWPAAERVLQDATVDDVNLIRASFALPASGMDL